MKAAILTLFLAVNLAFVPVQSLEAAKNKHNASRTTQKVKQKPLEVNIYSKRYRGGYSYRYTDTINSNRFVDPSVTSQSQGGPFDSGFFFATPSGPFGGYTPYMH